MGVFATMAPRHWDRVCGGRAIAVVREGPARLAMRAGGGETRRPTPGPPREREAERDQRGPEPDTADHAAGEGETARRSRSGSGPDAERVVVRPRHGATVARPAPSGRGRQRGPRGQRRARLT